MLVKLLGLGGKVYDAQAKDYDELKAELGVVVDKCEFKQTLEAKKKLAEKAKAEAAAAKAKANGASNGVGDHENVFSKLVSEKT